ncbi:MAG: hypothetical protein KAX68_04420 [Giesbergeria sp.]|nr:hypothetical protein [Giesbergeria sp.]
MLTKVPHLCRLVRTRQTRTAACGDLRHEWFAQGLVRAPHLTTMRGFALIGGLVIAKMLAYGRIAMATKRLNPRLERPVHVIHDVGFATAALRHRQF